MSLDILAGLLRKMTCPTCKGTGEDNPTGLLNASNLAWPRCPDCRGTGITLDPRWAALREALWEECDHGKMEGNPRAVKTLHEISSLAEERDMDCKGTGYVRRSHAEAALRLFDATHSLGWEPHMASIGRGPGWIADVFPNANSYSHGTGSTAEDALADAVEAAWRAEVRMSTSLPTPPTTKPSSP